MEKDLAQYKSSRFNLQRLKKNLGEKNHKQNKILKHKSLAVRQENHGVVRIPGELGGRGC